MRAIFRKNLTLQSRQMCTNIAQIIVPILGLLLVCFVREVVLSNADVIANQKISIPIPFFYNLPLKPLAIFGAYFNATECDEWYLY
jgi:hypothetical protein